MGDPVHSRPRARVRQRAGPFLWLGAALVLALAVWTAARSSDLGAQATVPPATASPTAPALLPPPPPVPRPTKPAPSAPARRPRAPTPQPTPRPTPGPSYWIRFGPTDDLEVLSEMVDRLAGSYAVVGRIQTRWTVRAYRVVSGPVAIRSAAEQRQALLAGVGLPSQLRSTPQGGHLLDFGEFQEPAAAEDRARAVRARGFVATVVPVRVPSYTVVVGPVSERVALAVARSLQASGFSFTLSHRP